MPMVSSPPIVVTVLVAPYPRLLPLYTPSKPLVSHFYSTRTIILPIQGQL